MGTERRGDEQGGADAHGSISGPGSPMKYRSEIDGLRAIAVLAVLGFHAFPRWLPGGFVGVDVFFVISGFLITGLLLSALERGTFSLRTFYARRVLRIFPALILTLGACWLFGWLVLFPDEYMHLGRHVAGGSEFLANFFFWAEAGYFDYAAERKPLLHLWSLGIEEQFYIVWPLLLYALWKLRGGFLAWLSVLAVVSFTINVLGLASYPIATFYSPASRAWELAIGGLLAAVTAERSDLLARLRRAATSRFVQPNDVGDAEAAAAGGAARANLRSGVGLGLVALSIALLSEERAFPGWWALMPTLGTALVLAAGPGAWLNRVVLSSRPAVWIGLISYPLYLWHWPLLSFARIVGSKPPALGYRLVALGLSFLLAALTYYLVERPFRFGRPIRWRVAVLAAGMVALAAAGHVTASARGLPGRATVRHDRVLQRGLLRPEDRAPTAACKRHFGFEADGESCLLDRADTPPTVALVGDSHGRHHYAGLSRYYREQGDNLVFLKVHPPFWGFDDPGIRRDRDEPYSESMLDFALESDTIHTVILATILKLRLNSEDGRSLVEKTSLTIERFVKAGKRVIVVNDVPRLTFDPRECLDRTVIPGVTGKRPCAVRRETFEKRTAAHNRALRAILARFPSVETFEPANRLCDERYCWALLGGKLLYRDYHHLSQDGDLLVGEWFGAERRAADDRRRLRGGRSPVASVERPGASR